jgi:hypothetical protein
VSGRLDKCPLCDGIAEFNVGYSATLGTTGYGGRCERCGSVHVTEETVALLKQSDTRYLLSAFFRRHTEGSTPLVTSKNVDEHIASMPLLRTVPEKMNGLLKLLVHAKLPPGSPISFDNWKDYPLVFAASGFEAGFLLEQLKSRKFLEPLRGNSELYVTADGYERVEQLEATSYKSTRNAFVAMWFDKSQDAIWKDAIEPAIRDAGYQPIRIDMTDHVNRIDDEIIAQLRQSRFLVADFTGQRPGVYYESGFMHGLGRHVIWLVEKSALKDVHFDVRQYNFIAYDGPEEAKVRLFNRNLAVEGRGPGPATKKS